MVEQQPEPEDELDPADLSEVSKEDAEKLVDEPVDAYSQPRDESP